MNKRIEELVEQAMDSVPFRVCQRTFKHIDDPAGPYVRKEFNKERFAELIVQDCASICDFEGESYKYSATKVRASWAKTTAGRCSAAIKRHFGIES